MKAVGISLVIWFVLVAAGVAAYYVYMYVLPSSLTDKLKGVKTKLLGVILAASPDIINLLSFVQLISSDWEPTDNTKWVLRGIGTAVTVLRYITDKEST